MKTINKGCNANSDGSGLNFVERINDCCREISKWWTKELTYSKEKITELTRALEEELVEIIRKLK